VLKERKEKGFGGRRWISLTETGKFTGEWFDEYYTALAQMLKTPPKVDYRKIIPKELE
jgi:hypothetical protein